MRRRSLPTPLGKHRVEIHNDNDFGIDGKNLAFETEIHVAFLVLCSKRRVKEAFGEEVNEFTKLRTIIKRLRTTGRKSDLKC